MNDNVRFGGVIEMAIDIALKQYGCRSSSMARQHVVHRIANHNEVFGINSPILGNVQNPIWTGLWGLEFSSDQRAKLMTVKKVC